MSKSGGWGPTKGLHPPPPTAPAQEDLSHDAIAQKISLCGAGSSSQAAHSLGGQRLMEGSWRLTLHPSHGNRQHGGSSQARGWGETGSELRSRFPSVAQPPPLLSLHTPRPTGLGASEDDVFQVRGTSPPHCSLSCWRDGGS